MVLRVKLSYIAFILFLIFAVAGAVVKPMGHSDGVAMVAFTFEEQPAHEKLLVSLFLDRLQEQSDQFYRGYYTVAPKIAYYFTTVKEIKETKTQIFITFTTLPYLGPHDAIGEDEITYSVSHAGEVTMISFRHVKSYALPDNLSHMESGPLPPISE